jgi:hypothetical protein
MLIAEKFLLDKMGRINFPIPEQNGYIGYEVYGKNKRIINFIDIKGTSFKSNFVRYCFSFYALEIDFESKTNLLTSKNIDIDYANYMQTLFEIKSKILSNSKFFIPKNKKELQILIWKSFLINKEKWFARNIDNMPKYFYDTVSESINEEERIQYIEKIINYLRNFDFLFHVEWEKHVNNFNSQYFLNWFYDFVMYGETL